MDLGLAGRAALVAASSRGLGKACALGLAREGAQVALCSRDEASVRAAAEEIERETGAKPLALAGDVRQAETCERLVRETMERFGRLDVLINNAGGPPGTTSTGATDEQWYAVFETNLLSAIRLTRLALPQLKQSGQGRVINITSSGVKQPIPNLALSNTIRASIINFAKTLSAEVAPDGVTVNNVAPGRIATDRVREIDESNAKLWDVTVDEVKRRQIAGIPMGRYAQPEEFANVVVFLASARAGYVTGQTILVDGGMVKSI